jgi:hypothetical protein
MRSGCDPGCSKRSPDALRDALCRYPGSASKHRSLRPTLAVAACAPRIEHLARQTADPGHRQHLKQTQYHHLARSASPL